jgi:hypothetical protein
MKKEIIGQISNVATEISQLNETLGGNLGDWDWQPAIIGLIGVTIGSLIAYVSNKKIQENEKKSRYIIQRKNLIYSPIYKELLSLSHFVESNSYYLEFLKNEESYSKEFYIDGLSRRKGKFLLWDKIKNDIRRNYISKKKAELLDKTANNISLYEKERDKIAGEFKKMIENSNIDKVYKKETGENDVGISKEFPDFLFREDKDYKKDIEKSHIYQSLKNKNPKTYSEIEKEYKNASEEINRQGLINSHKQLKKSIIKGCILVPSAISETI